MRHGDTNKALEGLLVQQSSEWIETLRRDDAQDNRRFASWLVESPRHVRTQLMMIALDEELSHIDPERRIPLPDRETCAAGTVSPFRQHRAPHRPAFAALRWKWAASLVLALGAIVASYSAWNRSDWQEYETTIGEQRSLQLADGSRLHLNTSTLLAVRLTEQSREIRLLRGEALFKVHHNASRPFSVQTADATITAVGTEFNVYRGPDATKVSVLEGRVRISSVVRAIPQAEPQRLLAVGEEADVDRGGRIVSQRVTDVSTRAAWTRRQLVFKQEPLANVVMQFNRYQQAPRFRIEGEALAARKYSGIFDLDDPQSLEDLLAGESDIVLEKTASETVIRLR